jgi:hypothetical protein
MNPEIRSCIPALSKDKLNYFLEQVAMLWIRIRLNPNIFAYNVNV